jgi:hypothetical protein
MRWLASGVLLFALGCGVVEHGGRLSSRPDDNQRIFLTTGASHRPYRTLGFAQLTGYGVAVAGLTEVGDAQLDSVIRGSLSEVALKMGGQGVIHIEFVDENPQTPAERAQSLANSFSNVGSGRGGVDTRNRTVVVTGEVIQFLQP